MLSLKEEKKNLSTINWIKTLMPIRLERILEAILNPQGKIKDDQEVMGKKQMMNREFGENAACKH